MRGLRLIFILNDARLGAQMQTQIFEICLLTECIFTLRVFKAKTFEKVKQKCRSVAIANEKTDILLVIMLRHS